VALAAYLTGIFTAGLLHGSTIQLRLNTPNISL
jgi:hypothetical protein